MKLASADHIGQLVEAARRARISRLDITDGETRVVIELPLDTASAPGAAKSKSSGPTSKDVRSDLVGFFRAAADGPRPGEPVSPDTVLGIVEQLGLPHDVLAGASGIIEQFYVEEGDVVEYGTKIATLAVK